MSFMHQGTCSVANKVAKLGNAIAISKFETLNHCKMILDPSKVVEELGWDFEEKNL